MARRRAWWFGMGIIFVVLLAFGAWRLLQEVPGLLAKAEDTIRKEAEALGIRVSFRDLRFHPLHLRVSAEDLDIRDGIAGIPLAHAEHVEASLSPRRILWGQSPVSRVLVRSFSVHGGEANRPLLEKFRASEKREGKGEIPEILLIDGEVHIGPLGPLEGGEAKVSEVRIRPVRFLGTRITAKVSRVAGRISLPGEGSGNVPFDSAEADFFLKGDSVRVRKLHASGPSAKITLSGEWDGPNRTVALQGSGELDIAEWTASRAVGGDWIRPVATEGKITFSAGVDGPLEDPEGAGKVLARDLVFLG
ncbi:MAG TPA: hypothetical protein VFU42_05395, partial [Candidatus Deferrimicrobiaceae bacterium]|nr:hypothetical protein [Candidatus Deferrimicrobiaceae bacterium]